jgi:hypothetical protein
LQSRLVPKTAGELQSEFMSVPAVDNKSYAHVQLLDSERFHVLSESYQGEQMTQRRSDQVSKFGSRVRT